METFQELPLPAFLHESLRGMKFDKPTPVQAQAIPPALEGRDVVASAETGSGKTAAFGVPLLTFLSTHPSQGGLILTPTRELAEQVRDVLVRLAGGRHDLRSALLIGGVGMGSQLDALRKGARLIIGTPGRINDHLEQRTLNLSRTGFLVLDEADRMLDMGFAPQLDRIRRWLTSPRQTLLFSATIPPDIERMAAEYLHQPVRISVGGQAKPVESIRQRILNTSQARKLDDLASELKRRVGSVLIFARTQHRVDRLARQLKERGFDTARIHGGRTQGQRRSALEQFKDGTVRVLVATDIAARGLDIQHIAHVVNYDLPMVPEDYVHRVGRTARAGAEGDSLSLLTPEDQELWRDILKALGTAQSSIEVLPSHYTDHPPASTTSAPTRHPGQGSSGRPPQGQGSHRGGPPSHSHAPSRGQGPRPGGAPPSRPDGNRRPGGERDRSHQGGDPQRRQDRPGQGERQAPYRGERREGQGRDDRSRDRRPEENRGGQNRGRDDHRPRKETNPLHKMKKWIKRLF